VAPLPNSSSGKVSISGSAAGLGLGFDWTRGAGAIVGAALGAALGFGGVYVVSLRANG
jgi:hypothetical protein